MPIAEIAASHYEPDGIGDGRKWAVNSYAEAYPGDPMRPFRMVTTPGSLLYPSGLATSCRGIWYQEGFSTRLIIADGNTINLITPDFSDDTLMTGTLTGSDRVQAAFSEVQAAFLSGGDIYIADDSSAFAVATDADYASLVGAVGQSDFTSIATLGQRLLATYGSRFCYSAPGDFDDTTTTNWYTAESSPDPLVCGVVLGDTYWLFGTQTIEPWVQTGNDDDPFQRQFVDPVRRGCLARDTVRQVDNTLMWIGDDSGLYRLDGLTPLRLDTKDAWVTRLIDETTPSDIICSSVDTEGHSFYFINTPTKCIVYDASNGTFHTRQTYGEDTWEWAYLARAGADVYAGSRLAAKLARLSRSYYWDNLTSATGTGTAIVRQNSAHLSVLTGRKSLESIRLDGVTGAGVASGQGSDPLVTLEISNDRGNTFGIGRDRRLGAQGEFDVVPFWTRNGRPVPGMTVLKFTMSEPVNYGMMLVAVNEGM